MARVKGGPTTRNRRKKVIKQASGYFGSKSILFKTAKEQVQHSLQYAYNDRRKVKSEYRKLWIKRINAACAPYDLSYSRFISGLKIAHIELNRKMISEMAINDEQSFKALVQTVNQALSTKAA
jgi:large subunit ribosomal protein L20